jgi:hypothetical protein
LRRGEHDRVCIDAQERTRRTEDANALHNDVSVEEFAERFDRLFTVPQRRYDLAGANVELQDSLACTHDIQSTSHPNSSRRRSNGIQLRGGGHDTCVDLSSAVEDGVGHGDAIDSATDHALVCSDSTEHPGIEAIAFRTPNCNVVQGCTEQLECSFLRLWAVVPEKPLLEELRRDAPKGRHFEVKQRRSVLAAVADKSDFGCRPQRSRYTTTRAAGMKKPHPHGIQQRPFQAAEYGPD